MSQQEKSKLIMDDTTIYEIDLDCQKCQGITNKDPMPPGSTIYWDFPPSDCQKKS